MKEGVYDYQVQPGEVDLTQKASIITVGDHILHAAGEDADRLGFGLRLMQSQNATWVLSRMAIEMARYPKEYETYHIETWVYDINRLMTTRCFILRDDQDEIIGQGCTFWSMINFQTRAVLDLRTLTDYQHAIRSDEPPLDRPIKIAKVEGEHTVCEERRVRYSDIDFNQHTNSMKYVQWMVDMLPLEKISQRHLSRLDINFLHETRHGQQVTVTMENSDQCDRFEVKLLPEAHPACRASLQWK